MDFPSTAQDFWAGVDKCLNPAVTDALGPANQQNSSLDTHQRILLVDDDPDLLDMYQEILVGGLAGRPEVQTATSGPRALAMLEAGPFQMLICDLKMPRMDGFQVLSIARRKYPQMRQVVLTCNTDEQFRLRAYALGADLFCDKPGTEEETKVFLKSIQSLLKRKSPQPPRKRPLRIVVLDDEDTMRESYRVLLQGWYEGVVVVQCHTGDEAWEELSRADRDLFITDRAHTGMSCGEMLERLAERKAKFPIFLISAGVAFLGEAALRSAGENLDFSAWHKPFNVYQFRQALETALRMPVQQEP